MALNSCLYDCVITHRRLHPKRYAFEHRIMMLYVDLAELQHLNCRLLGIDRANLYSFRDADFFPTGAAGNLAARVHDYLRRQEIDLPADARIKLLTLPRILGYIFNPISVYFCFTAGGTALCAIAEVGNTFRESKLFLLPSPAADQSRARFHLRVPKQYYVSPFSSLDLCFDFDLQAPEQTLQLHIDDYAQDIKTLESHLRGTRLPLTDGALLRFALKYPALSLKVIGLIHWHALLLWLKRVPFYRKASHPEQQLNVLNPRP